MRRRIVFGSRKSKLALAQTVWVMDRLREVDPELELEVRTITTTGDRILDSPLSALAGKGVFVKEIEEALLSNEVDIAVHSMKDLPTQQPEGLTIAAVPGRADPRDVLVSANATPFRQLPSGSRIGTSSLRRAAQVKHLRPELHVADIRGNVDTRLRKVEEGVYDATILAAAGLDRLGWRQRATHVFEPEEFLPAPGQGALGIEVRQDDTAVLELVGAINEVADFRAVEAERTFLAALGGGCKVPIGALGRTTDQRLQLYGMVASPDGQTLLRDEIAGAVRAADELGRALAERLKSRGAQALLNAVEEEAKG